MSTFHDSVGATELMFPHDLHNLIIEFISLISLAQGYTTFDIIIRQAGNC